MCEYIKLEGGGTAFICNCGKNKGHECDEKATVLLLEDGSEVEDTKENQLKYEDKIRGGSVACSICGRSAFQNAAWM